MMCAHFEHRVSRLSVHIKRYKSTTKEFMLYIQPNSSIPGYPGALME